MIRPTAVPTYVPTDATTHAAGRADARDVRLVGRVPSSTGAERSRRWRSRPVPEDLLRRASRRLEIIALLAAVVWTASTILYHVVDRAGEAGWWGLQSSDALAASAVVMSLALFVYARRASADPRFVLDLGLAYLVAMALISAVIQSWDPPPGTRLTPRLGWNGVSALIFAALMPSEPRKFAVAALLAVGMEPVGMLIGRARGVLAFESALTPWAIHYQSYLMAGISIVISNVVWGMGQQVARAREMGSYQLGDLIGRGGMGEVYKATHRMLARPAAIKLIRPEMLAARTGEQGDLAVARFHREAAAVATLRSPHTVDLYDFGATEDGTLYFAMELLDGLDLESVVRRTGPLPASRVIHVLRQVCDSLEEAHAVGLVHRDIKPANIHLGRVGLRHDVAKVLDFGLVTSRGKASRLDQLTTDAGTVPGTPAYMAPEIGLDEPVDGRADIYALGCVAYFLLTGHLVFEAESPMQSLLRRMQEEPVPPSQRTALTVAPDVDALVLACLARTPGDRPTAADLARSLALLHVEPWTDDEAREWWATHRPAPVTERS
jgi:eukaryotic-like serine/threonine-protein kinase